MVHVEAAIKKWGNSLAVIIPKRVTKRLGLNEGAKISIEIRAKKKMDAFGMFKGAKPFEEEKERHKKFW